MNAGMRRPHPLEVALFASMVPEKGDTCSKIVKLRHQCRRYREYAELVRNFVNCYLHLLAYL